MGMYNYFTERPVRTKVKPVKLYAQDNAIHSQALQITNNRYQIAVSENDFCVTVTVLQFLKSKIPKDSQDMALNHESH